MIVQMLLETTSKGGATAGTAGGGFLFATVARGIYRGFKRRGANKKKLPASKPRPRTMRGTTSSTGRGSSRSSDRGSVSASESITPPTGARHGAACGCARPRPPPGAPLPTAQQ